MEDYSIGQQLLSSLQGGHWSRCDSYFVQCLQQSSHGTTNQAHESAPGTRSSHDSYSGTVCGDLAVERTIMPGISVYCDRPSAQPSSGPTIHDSASPRRPVGGHGTSGRGQRHGTRLEWLPKADFGSRTSEHLVQNIPAAWHQAMCSNIPQVCTSSYAAKH